MPPAQRSPPPLVIPPPNSPPPGRRSRSFHLGDSFVEGPLAALPAFVPSPVPAAPRRASPVATLVQASALPTAEEAGSSQKGASGLFSFGRDGAEPIPVQFLSAFTEKLKFRRAWRSGTHIGRTEVPAGAAVIRTSCRPSSDELATIMLSVRIAIIRVACARNSTQQTACVPQSQPCRQDRTLWSRPASKKRTGPCPGSGESGRAVPCCSKSLKTKRLRSPQRLRANLIEERLTATEMTTVFPYPKH
jgi:hypothetical protein